MSSMFQIETPENLLLLYSETDDKGIWIDKGCGQELPRYDDVEIKKDINNEVYLIVIVQNNLFDDVSQAITGAHIRFAFSDITGNEYTHTADVSEAVRINPEETVTYRIESIEDSETKLDEKVIQYFVKSGIKDRNKKQKLSDHPDQYECRSCTITLSDEKPEFYFAKPEFDPTESELIFVDEDIFDGYSDMESNTIILYYFVPKQRDIHDTFVASPAYLNNFKLRSSLSREDLVENATFMLLDKENVTRKYVDNALASSGIELQNVMEVSNMDLLIDFAKTDLGISSVIREFVIKDIENGNLKEVKILNRTSGRQIGFAYNPSKLKENPSAALFTKFVNN